MTNYSDPLQLAIYTALTGASVAGGRVYDRPQSNVAFPYVEIGEAQVIPDDVSTTSGGSDQGLSEFVDLHIWSDYQGQKEAKDIADAIRTALHETTLTVTGRASALCFQRNARILRDPDGVRTHGVMSFEIIHRNTP